MKIGNVIKAVRNNRKISQGELAKACNITQSYLSQIENDTKAPSNTLLTTMSEILKVPVAAMYYLALEDKDVPDESLAAHHSLSATIESLVKSVYLR